MHPITEATHYTVAKIIREVPQVTSVIDMGGTGKLKQFLDCKIIDVNINKGMDACNLPFDDNTFDIACSIATLEHVKDQRAFLEESIRVAKKGIVHWFPCGKAAEKVEEFRETLLYKHPCIVPSIELIDSFLLSYPALKITDYISCETHLLLLATLRPELQIPEVYDKSLEMNNKRYGIILYGNILGERE
jgi:SAM-dependent methyltransferase